MDGERRDPRADPDRRAVTSIRLLPKQVDHIRPYSNRFAQRVPYLYVGDVVGVRRQRQHVAAVPEPLGDLNEVHARR